MGSRGTDTEWSEVSGWPATGMLDVAGAAKLEPLAIFRQPNPGLLMIQGHSVFLPTHGEQLSQD